MGRLNVTDVRRERNPLLWSTVGEITLAKVVVFPNMGDTKYPGVRKRTKLPGRGVHNEVKQIGRR